MSKLSHQIICILVHNEGMKVWSLLAITGHWFMSIEYHLMKIKLAGNYCVGNEHMAVLQVWANNRVCKACNYQFDIHLIHLSVMYIYVCMNWFTICCSLNFPLMLNVDGAYQNACHCLYNKWSINSSTSGACKHHHFQEQNK